MSRPRTRRRVDPVTFAAWRAALPQLALPPWLDQLDLGPTAGSPSGESGAPNGRRSFPVRGVTVPPMVGTALGVQADPRVSVLYAVQGAGGTGVGSVAVDGDVASAVLRRVPAGDPVPGSGWVELALVPLPWAVGEVLRQVPMVPDGPWAGVRIQVVRRDDAVPRELACWSAGPDGWQRELIRRGVPARVEPVDPSDLPDRLESAFGFRSGRRAG